MIELMFAVALSGMRAGETAAQEQLVATNYRLRPSTAEDSPQRDWRKWIGSDSSFEDERDCPVFFQKEIPGFGVMRVNSACAQTRDDELWP